MLRLSAVPLPLTAVIMTAAPVGSLALALLLLALADVAVVVAIARLIIARRRAAAGSVVMIDDAASVRLRRRTRPELRARRPAGIIEMQVRWRQAAEAHRRSRSQG